MKDELATRRVKDEMTKVVVSVSPEDNVLEAINLMAEYRVTVLPVTDGKNRCVGIISTTDLVDPERWQKEGEVSDENLGDRAVQDLMTANVESVDREATVHAATGTMLRQRVHHLPVVDEHQQLLGIVSTMDLLAAFYKASES